MRTSPEFQIAGNIPFSIRIIIICLLLAVGVMLQLIVHPLLGFVLIFFAALLGIIKGKSNRPQIVSSGVWQNVTIEEFQSLSNILSRTDRVQTKQWATCKPSLGCVAGIGFLAFILFSGMFIQNMWIFGSAPWLIVIDCATLLIPIIIGGRVTAWEPPYLNEKLKQMNAIAAVASTDARLELAPSMLLSQGRNGMVPMDCKLFVKVKDANPDFMGIQVQTSMNDVQGTKYPYTYCVLIANPKFGLIRAANALADTPHEKGFLESIFGSNNKDAGALKFMDAVMELKIEGDKEIVVIRQETSGEGYRTRPEQAVIVFRAASMLAEAVTRK